MTAGRRGAWVGFVVLAFLAACTSPVTVPQDTSADRDVPADGSKDAPADDVPGADTPDGCTPGVSTVRFQVDDRANGTYGDKQMKWQGSFSWNEADNTITYATSWLPDQGPFPPLYDDGPKSAGGHEPEGAVKGDHLFQIEVFVQADEDLTFDYGVLNELDGWIWIGPNGQFTLSHCAPGAVDAAPLTLPAFGDVDLKLTLDLNALAPKFAGTTLETSDVYLKSTANSWTNVALVDDGNPDFGDDVAGDGILTFVQSKRLGAHDGLLAMGQHAQFVFVFPTKEGDPVGALEYKDGSTVLAEGVKAYTDAAQKGTFAEVPIVWEKAARGKEFNTTVVVGGGKPWCAKDEDCFGGATCGADGCGEGTPISTPALSGVAPASGPVAGGTAIVLTGSDFRDGATVTLGGTAATGVSVASATEIHATTPAHAAGTVDVVVRNADSGTATAAAAFEYLDDVPPVSTPVLSLIDPVNGPVTGGTEVVLTGKDFRTGCAVTFGGTAATAVAFVSATEVRATTPAHAEGVVDVELVNPDTGRATYPNAFEFLEPKPPAVIDWGRLDPPLSIDALVGDALPDARAQAYEPGVTTGGGGEGLVTVQVGWGPAGSDPRQAGAGWTWADGAYDGTAGETGNNAAFRGSLAVTAAGTYAYTFRFSLDGGTTWTVVDSDGVTPAGTDFSTALLGTLTLAEPDPDAPGIATVTPAWDTCAGGTTITVAGQRLAGTTKVTLGGVDAAATVNGDGTSLTFAAPAHAASLVGLSLVNGAGKTASKAGAFAFAPKAATAPTIDGTIGADWDANHRVQQNGVATDWGADLNVLDSLWVAYDATNLYLGVAGTCQAANAIVVYVDRDFGAGTGLADMSLLTDGTGSLDNALSSKLNVSTAGFGAEKAVGTRGMASFTCTDPGNQAGSDPAGWRDLGNRADLGWDCGQVTATASGFEAKVPLQTFFGGAMPAAGANLAVVVRLVNENGEACSNQSLPPIGGGTFTQNTVVVVPVR